MLQLKESLVKNITEHYFIKNLISQCITKAVNRNK